MSDGKFELQASIILIVSAVTLDSYFCGFWGVFYFALYMGMRSKGKGDGS